MANGEVMKVNGEVIVHETDRGTIITDAKGELLYMGGDLDKVKDSYTHVVDPQTKDLVDREMIPGDSIDLYFIPPEDQPTAAMMPFLTVERSYTIPREVYDDAQSRVAEAKREREKLERQPLQEFKIAITEANKDYDQEVATATEIRDLEYVKAREIRDSELSRLGLPPTLEDLL